MARKILIVNSSATMRRIIGNMILANINDVEFAEASDADAAWKQIKKQNFHLLLFSWEPSGPAWFDFFTRLAKHPAESRPASIFLVSDSSRAHVEEILEAGVSESLSVPCTQMELTEAIYRACNPMTLRNSNRYSLPDTTAVLRQEGKSYPAGVINISQGGLLCELDYAEDYKWTDPILIDVTFSIDGEQLTATELYSLPSRFSIIETNADFTPRRIKLACRFFNVPAASREVFTRVFGLAEEQEKMLYTRSVP